MKRVLIAHQSTIPHYRVPFYNAIEKLKPNTWSFDVVFDPSELVQKRFFEEETDLKSFKFTILRVNTIAVPFLGKTVSYQTFWRKARAYDLVIIEQSLNNLTYPLCQLHQLTGTKFAYWGHGKDRSVVHPPLWKQLAEEFKIELSRRADGFFAYTPGVKKYLEGHGLQSQKIFSLNNTIDILAHRQAYEHFVLQREEIRKSLELQEKKVLVFVGRFTKSKRIEFLLESFSTLKSKDPDCHLLLIGSGGDAYLPRLQEGITYFGSVTDLAEIAPFYVAADVFVFPGLVGLAPLTALCYDLPVVVIDAKNHKPEIEYLVPENSLILDMNTTPESYASAVLDLLYDKERLQILKNTMWSSIQHLTIENMAYSFIEGVNSILN